MAGCAILASSTDEQAPDRMKTASEALPSLGMSDEVPLERDAATMKQQCCHVRESFLQQHMALKQFISGWSQQQDRAVDRMLSDLGVGVCSKCACNTCSPMWDNVCTRQSAEQLPESNTARMLRPAEPEPPLTRKILPTWQASLEEVPLSAAASAQSSQMDATSSQQQIKITTSRSTMSLARIETESDDEDRENLANFFGERINRNNMTHVTKAAKALGLKEGASRDTNGEPTGKSCTQRIGQSMAKGLDFIEKQLTTRSPPVEGQSGVFARIVFTKRFESLSCMVILANSGFLAYTSDYARKHLDNPSTPFMDWVEVSFCFIYTVELILRLCAYKRYFFLGEDWRWNTLDVVLVLFAINDQISNLLEASTDVLQNMSFLRVMRLMKMMKLLRVIRLMRMFRELRIIMNSILGSVKAMLWSLMLVISIIFLFAMCFVQASTEYLRNQGSDVSPQTQRALDKYWGTVVTAMDSLYRAVTGGEDWYQVARPLQDVGVYFYIIFLCYVGFMLAVVANTLTSMFVEAAILNGDKDIEQSIHRELENINEHVNTLQRWFQRIDVDKDGEISLDEFRVHCSAPEMLAFAKSLELDALDVKRFFSIISGNGARAVDLETFVVGCVKLQGMARNMDLMDLTYKHRICAQDQNTKLDYILSDMTELRKHLRVPGNPACEAGGDFGGSSAQGSADANDRNLA